MMSKMTARIIYEEDWLKIKSATPINFPKKRLSEDEDI